MHCDLWLYNSFHEWVGLDFKSLQNESATSGVVKIYRKFEMITTPNRRSLAQNLSSISSANLKYNGPEPLYIYIYDLLILFFQINLWCCSVISTSQWMISTALYVCTCRHTLSANFQSAKKEQFAFHFHITIISTRPDPYRLV